MGGFHRVSTIFLEFFGNFYNFLENFCDFFGKFSQNFCNFFQLLQLSYDFSRKFFRKFLPTIHYGSTGVSPYCKFTSKFTSKFTPILIKILQSIKFEDGHFFNFLSTFIAPYPLSQPFSTSCALSSRYRVFSTMAPLCKRYQRPSLPLRRRRYVGNTRDYK